MRSRMLSPRSPSGTALWPVDCGATRRPRAAGEADDGQDVVRRGGVHDGERALVDVEGPRLAGGIPAGVFGKRDLALQQQSEVLDGVCGGFDDGHGRGRARLLPP